MKNSKAFCVCICVKIGWDGGGGGRDVLVEGDMGRSMADSR